MPFITKENAKEMAARGLAVRMMFRTPESRRLAARKAAARRWYRDSADDLERIESLLTLLASEIAHFMLTDDHRAVVSAVSAMAGIEKIKIALRAVNEKNVTPELSQEIEGKLAKARERREAALSEPVEISPRETKPTT